jgi:exonuclease SbcC|nr:MAG TPA: STRUCTURAL MAINTENANCE OF CHROMOSOMES PROTEIN [Caudoviricetes sp.]
MYPTRIVLKNFGPFESIDYDFKQEAIAVIGENRTQDDQLSNGSGKSFLEQGLFYGIYGVNLRDKQDKKLIRKGFDTAYICVFIYCPIRRQTLKIERELRAKGSSVLAIYLIHDGDEIEIEKVQFATVLDGNRYIANWVEISAEDAKSYYIVSKGNYNSFFRSSNTEKLALISRFINFSMLDKTKSIIDDKVLVLNEEKQVLDRSKASYEGKLSVYQEQLQEILDSNPEEEQLREIKKAEDYIEDVKRAIESNELRISKEQQSVLGLKHSLSELEKLRTKVSEELSNIDTSNFDTIYKEIDEDVDMCRQEKRTKENSLNVIQNRIVDIKRTLNKIEVLLSGIIVCPNCQHEFFLKTDKTVQEIKKHKEATEIELNKESAAKENIEKSIEELDAVLDEYMSLKSQTDKEFDEVANQQRNLKKKVLELEHNIGGLDQQIKSKENLIKTLQNEIENGENLISLKSTYIEDLKNTKVVKKSTDEIENTIKETEHLINDQCKKITDKNDEIFKIQRWTQRFKDFKMYLAMEQLKNIQSRANEILKSMGSDLRLMIEGFKVDAKGKVKEEITPYVFRDEMESFFYYSGGEQARTEIALILAIQQMINATKQYGGMQFLLVDEILESADSLGIENIISSIKFLKQSSIIVTHVPKINEEISQIRIIKENGISRLEE